MKPLLMIGLFLAADLPTGDMERIQGTWVLVSSESEGETRPSEALKSGPIKMEFEGDRVIARMGDKTAVLGTFALDPTTTPKAYDRTYPDGTPRRGIYELEGDTLKICLAPLGQERPTAFATKPGNGVSLLIYKREKP